MRLSSFILGILAVAFIISAFAIIMGDIGTHSVDNVGTTNFSSYEKVDAIRTKSDAIKTKVTNISSEKTGFDIVGRLFGTGVDTISLTYSSIELGVDMTDDAFGGVNSSDSIPMGNVGTLFNTFIIAGIIILVFVGIILSIIIRRDV